ncbi:MAG TPA: VWA domain-containing protein [Candidatus Binatia bacterium]
MGSLEFARPQWLWLVALLPLLWMRYGRLPAAAIAWRSSILLLVVAALADPRIVEPTSSLKRVERVFAFDVSRSVPAETRRWIARQELLPSAGDRIILFAGAPAETSNWKQGLETPGDNVRPERTNLERLFSALLNLPRAERSVFLFTDGWENEGSAERLLPALGEAGIKVYPVLPPSRPPVANIAVKKVIAPAEAVKGEAILVKVSVENGDQREVDGNLTLKRVGRPDITEAVRLQPGSQLLSYQVAVGDGPLEALEAEFTPSRADADLLREDNRATAWVGVRTKEKALIINGRSGEGRYLEELLKRRGFEITSIPAGGSMPAPAPTGYGIVVLNNVDKDHLSAGYLSALERHTSAGNGLVVLGDDTALPPGYKQTPLAAALPVDFIEPKENESQPEKTRAVLVVIDKSRSMDPEANPPHENRILYAKEIAKRVISQLADSDLIGVIGFDTAPFPVVQMDNVRNLRSTFARDVDRLVPKGNTDILSALRGAMAQLQRQPADAKYVILITDADQVGGRPSEYTELVTRMRNEGKIIVSAVGVGRGVDEALVKRIGTYGGGVYHIPKDLNDFPTLRFEQGQRPPPTAAQAQAQEFMPIPSRNSEILAPLEAQPFPRVRGYVEAELKPAARLDLRVQNKDKSSPLLASWSYGKGKVAVLTIDQSGRWSRDWIGWSGLERFWGRVFDWLKPQGVALPPYEARIDRSGDQVQLDFFLYSAESDGNPYRYSYSGPRGEKGDGALKRLAPGHYQAALPFAAAGDYRVELKEDRRGRAISYPALGYTRPPEATSEAPTGNVNIALLQRIARATGGSINPAMEAEARTQKPPATVRYLQSYLILAAALLFVAEAFIRRLLPSRYRTTKPVNS